MKEDTMGRIYGTHGRGDECIRLLVRKSKGYEQLEIIRRKFENRKDFAEELGEIKCYHFNLRICASDVLLKKGKRAVGFVKC
jgi:hypothetical protein